MLRWSKTKEKQVM